MNGSAVCHEIQGVPGLFVDAFRGSYLRMTQDERNGFILTHYHGDHYGSLPRDGKYQGPALIHCTPVTAALLVSVHNVPSCYVVEHGYGETWTYRCYPTTTTVTTTTTTTTTADNDHNKIEEKQDRSWGEIKDKVAKDLPPNPLLSSVSAEVNKNALVSTAQITFYDANHCPGAAIVLIQLDDGTAHLHTGDMRFHSKMKDYPLLRDVVVNRKLDLLYLDTTYCHPKHNFSAQQDAIETIGTQIEQQFLGGTTTATTITRRRDQSSSLQQQPKQRTLILLSCYSIGKEKVLWEAATRTHQQIYVKEKKFKMLQCVEKGDCHHSQQIIHHCTKDADQSDIHVIRMGLAGEMWPFFRPNFRACADYEEKLSKQYDRVVAFLPTGWANASNWNKKNAIRTKRIELPIKNASSSPQPETTTTTTTTTSTTRFLEVQVRCFSYSEHSSYDELVSFVQYLRPRKVVPTVFSDDKERRKIEDRFRNLVDSARAKKAFFKSMQQQPRSLSSSSTSSSLFMMMQNKKVVHDNITTNSSSSSGSISIPVEAESNSNVISLIQNKKVVRDTTTTNSSSSGRTISIHAEAESNSNVISLLENDDGDDDDNYEPQKENNTPLLQSSKCSKSNIISLLDDDDDDYDHDKSHKNTPLKRSNPTEIRTATRKDEEKSTDYSTQKRRKQEKKADMRISTEHSFSFLDSTNNDEKEGSSSRNSSNKNSSSSINHNNSKDAKKAKDYAKSPWKPNKKQKPITSSTALITNFFGVKNKEKQTRF